MRGTDYSGSLTSPAIVSGAWLLPETLVIAEVRPNTVTVEGSDGTAVVRDSGTHSAGLGKIGEYLKYSYVLDVETLTAIADARLAGNVRTVAATIGLHEGHPLRPWVDFRVGDIIYVDLATHGLPADWYRVEKIAGAFTDEGEGFRYVIDVGRSIVLEDAIVADRVDAILRAGLIDLNTGLVTAAETGQAATTVVITSDEIPDHTHGWDDLPARTVGGDLSGTADNASVRKVRGYAHASDPAPADGDTWVWGDANEIAEWRPRWTYDTAAARATAAATPGDLRDGDVWVDTDDDSMHVWDATGVAWVAVSGGGASPLTTKGDLFTYGTGDARLPVGTNGQVLTADSAETLGVKWADAAAGGGATFSGARLSQSSAQTLTDNVEDTLEWNTEDFDTDGYADLGTNNTRLTLPSAGKYLVGYTVRVANLNDGDPFYAYVLKNGTTRLGLQAGAMGATGVSSVTGVAIVDGAANDYFEVVAFFNFGATRDTNTADTRFWITSLAGGGGAGWADTAMVASAPSGTYDDEFDDASIDAAWATELDITGTTTWTESNDLMSCKFASQATSDVAALLKSMTLNVGDYVETAVRLFGKDEAYSMVGICMSDGTAGTSNAVTALFYQGGTSPVIDAGRNGTFGNLATGGPPITMEQTFAFPWLHIRLTYQAANTFRVEVSPDGVSWTNQGVADVTPTITPTHAGLVVSRWGGGAEESIASFQYFRSNA